MSVDDRVLNAIQFGPRRKKYIIAFLLLSIPLFPAAYLTVLISLLFWLFYARAKIHKEYFREDQRFSSEAEAIAAIGAVGHHQRRTRITLKCTKRIYGIGAPRPFLLLLDKPNILIITPAHYWSWLDGNFVNGDSGNIVMRPTMYGKETLDLGQHDEVISSRWEHPTKSGDRDYRYKENFEVFKVQRFGVTLVLRDGTEWKMGDLSTAEQANQLAGQFEVVTGGALQRPSDEAADDGDEHEADDEDTDGTEISSTSKPSQRPWHEILGVDPDASRQTIKQARDKLVRGLHPDRLKAIEGLNPDIEQYAQNRLVEVNLAYEDAMRSRGI